MKIMNSKNKTYKAALASILIGISLPVLAQSPEQDEQRAKADEEKRQETYTQFETKNRETLDKSAVYADLKKSGLLDKAEAVDGPPPGVKFSVEINGKKEDLMLLLAYGEPVRPEQLVLLSGKQKPSEFTLGKDGTVSERIAKGIKDSCGGGAAPEHGVAVQDGADPGSVVAGKEQVSATAQSMADWLQSGKTGSFLGGTATGPAVKTSSSEFVEVGKDGLRSWFRYEKDADGKMTKVPVARQTAGGMQFLEGSAGHEPGVERYSRTWNGEKAFFRVENGVPKITHVERNGKWVPLAEAKLGTRGLKGQLVQEASDGSGGNARFAYSIDENGKGVRTHQLVQLDNKGYWLALDKGLPIAKTEGVTRQVVNVGRMKALVEFGPDGSARATHLGEGSTLRLASEYGLQVDNFSQVTHKIKSPDGKEDTVAYKFKRGEDGAFTGTMYAQRARGMSSDTWIAVEGKPLERPAGSQMQLLRSGQDKLLVQFKEGGTEVKVLAAGTGAFIGGDLSKAGKSSFSAEVVFEGDGAKPDTGFRYAFKPSEDKGSFEVSRNEQRVDIGLGLAHWAKLTDGKPLAGEALARATHEARVAKIAELNKELAVRESESQKKLRDGLAWYNSNRAVASRLSSVFQARKPAPVTAEEIRAAANKGNTVGVPELGDPSARGELVHRIGQASEAPARSLVIVAAGDKDAAAHQARLEEHRKITEAWVRDPSISIVERAQRLLTVPSMLPKQATVVMASRNEIQSQLDAKVNPGINAMPMVAAGVGISQDPGKAAYGAQRLNPYVPARKGGGGGLLGRMLDIPGRADEQIRSQAAANLNRAGSEMAQARADVIGTVSMGVQAKRLETIATAEENFAKQGIRSVNIVDVAYAKPVVGFSYKRDDGSRYLLNLNINESVLPPAPQASSLPGTPGQRLVMAVDSALAYKAGWSKGISQSTIEAAWDNAIIRQYGVDASEAARIRTRILAGN